MASQALCLLGEKKKLETQISKFNQGLHRTRLSHAGRFTLPSSRRVLSCWVTFQRPWFMGTMSPFCLDALASCCQVQRFHFKYRMFSSSVITHSCLTTRLQEAGCCTLPWSCLRPKHNIFRFQESVKGHRLVEFKIFFQLSSRPTESVLNARRKGQQVNRVALKMLFLEMTEFDVWSSPPPSF